MVVFHGELEGRKPTGGRIRAHRKKRKYELGREATLTTLSNVEKRLHIRTKGGGLKIKLKKAMFANVFDPKTKVMKKVRILNVVENKSHPLFARSNIITKGAIIKTEIGTAKVTSRPGQHGVINAILLEHS